VVVFGPGGKYDEGRTYQSIKVTCPEIPLFKDYDAESESHPLVKTYNDIQFITLKILSDHPSLSELTRDVACLVIVTPRPWKMGVMRGVSLVVDCIKIVNKPMKDLVFIE
jgi:hypothetical protein